MKEAKGQQYLIKTDEQLAKIIANNLTLFRKSLGLTQLELAEKLNYSDKSISKWERGDGIPDVIVLQNLARLYDTTIDALCSEKTVIKKRLPESEQLRRKRRFIISLIVGGSVWFLAAAVYVLLTIITERSGSYWLAFIYAIPISATVLYVCNLIWGNKILNVAIMSVIAWSLTLSVYLSLVYVPYIWLMFVLAGVFQVLLVLWMFLIIPRRIKKSG